MTEPWQLDLAEFREAQFQSYREKRERFGEPITGSKTMTQLEMFKAAEAVRENLNIPGCICIGVDCWGYHRTGEDTRRRVEWRVSFVPQNDSGPTCIQESGHRPDAVLGCWTERMRLKYGPRHNPGDAELAETLDAHRAAESAL